MILLSAVCGAAAQKLTSSRGDWLGTAVQSLDVENGLPQGYVNGIVQDSAGFIWLSTRDGLARYDGYQVKTFHYDPQDSATIASDVIQTLYADREDQLWILYENGGVDIFDPVTEQVRHIRSNGPLGWLLDDREYLRPFVMQQDSRGKYWVVSSNKKRIRCFTAKHPAPVSVSIPDGERVVAFREGRDGNMYICTSHAFYRVKGERLSKISDLPVRRVVRNDRIGQMMQDARGNWVIVNNGYLDIFKSGGDWESVILSAETDHTPFFFMDRSPAGDLYVSSEKYIFRIESDYSLSKVWTNASNPGDIPAMMIDRSNVLWLGTNTFGARMIHLSTGGFRSYAYNEGFVPDVLRQWFHLPSTEEYARFLDPYLLRYAADSTGRLWVLGTPSFSPASDGAKLLQLTGEKRAVAVLRADSLHWLQFTFDRYNDCWALVRDSQGDTVLVNADIARRTAELVPSWRPALGEVGYLLAFGDQLCVVYKKGIELFDPVSGHSEYFTSRDFFGHVQLMMAVCDPRDSAVLWITGLGYGLIRFDTGSGQVRAFTVKEGIPSNTVYAAVADENGRLWCSSNKGVFRFDPVSHQVLSFVAKDGLQGNEFNRYHFLQSPGGHIIFGGTRGWTIFHPDSIYVDSYQPETVITDILVNNQPVQAFPAWENRAVAALSGLSLAYDQNFVTFTFAGLQFSNPGKLRYRYRLEGFDAEWIDVGSQHIAGYTNLPPGEYVFKVNSSSEAGTWSSHVKAFPLTIRPPWWKTWWACCLYALMFLGAGYVFFRYRVARLRIERQIMRQQEEAKQAKQMDELKSRFFSNITHEFRTPLSLIIAPLEQISREKETSVSIRERLNGIQSSARHLFRLVDQLLDMSKMEAGSMTVSLSRGDLGLFIMEQVNVFETQARIRDIGIGIGNDLREEYEFDVDKWQKILFNLLSNAIKYTSDGGFINVSLAIRNDDGVFHTVVLEVKDSGIGIPEKELPLIFNRYYQGGNSGAPTSGGTGIGLALVRELAELMNGTAEAESRPGEGSLFRVIIPVKRAAGKTAGDSYPISPELFPVHLEKMPDTRLGGQEKATPGREAALILLVEDNEPLNAFMADTLGKEYRVLTAGNGKDGLRIAKERSPELIISDIMMPEMDGYALCEELKGSVATDHIAIILLSAKTSHDSVIKGLKNHADDYITKPFHIDELQLRVYNLIERQRRLRDHYHRQLTVPGEQLDTGETGNLFLSRLYAVIERNLGDPELDVGMLAGKMAVNRRTLNRKLAALVNLSASEIIRQYRLKKAATLLRAGLNVSETAYRVGFTSASYFSNSFKEFYGEVPSAQSRVTDEGAGAGESGHLPSGAGTRRR